MTQPLVISKNLLAEINFSNVNQVVRFTPISLLASNAGLLLNRLVINREIANLKLNIRLSAFPKTPFPEQLTSSLLTDLEQNLIIRENEWNSENKIYFEVLQSSQEQPNWQVIDALTIVNRDGFPYAHPSFNKAINAFNGVVSLDQTTILGFKVNTNKQLQQGEAITATGFYRETIFNKSNYQESLASCTNTSITVTTSGIEALPANQNRAFFKITNVSSSIIWLNLGQLNGPNTGDAILPGEARQYSAINNFVYTGAVWLISSQPAAALIISCFN